MDESGPRRTARSIRKTVGLITAAGFVGSAVQVSGQSASPPRERIAFASGNSATFHDEYVFENDDGSTQTENATWTFPRDFRLRTIFPNGAASRTYSFSGADDLYPTWSPDGQKVAWARLVPRNLDEFNGTEGGDFAGFIGTLIFIFNMVYGSQALSGGEEPAVDGVYVSNVDFGTQALGIDGGGDPSWSPDNKKMAFTRHGGGISVADIVADGPGTFGVTESNLLTSGIDVLPAFSPDGKRVAFTRLSESSIDVMQVHLELGTETFVASSLMSMHPSWTPDGRGIVMFGCTLTDSGCAEGSAGVYCASVLEGGCNGEGVVQRSAGVHLHPHYSADGKSILATDVAVDSRDGFLELKTEVRKVFGPGAAVSGGDASVSPSWSDADTDGDAIRNSWEANGIAIDGRFLDLPAMQADPEHKDVFLEVDWMPPPARRLESDEAFTVVTVFDEAPVENIFGSGISLHIDAGPDSLLAPGLPWGDLSQANEVPYAANANSSYTVAARNTHLSPERRPVFRYAIAGDSAPVGQTFSGQAEADGVNLILVPNSPCRGRSPCQVSSEKIARILMHELGHTLGLGHAGPRIVLGDFAKRNNEHPNYLSIMNYKFTGGLPKSTGEFVLDFSRFGPPLFDLDEQLLQESLGLGADASSVNNLETGYLCPNGSARRVTIGEPVDIDWNCNGIIDAQAVSVDLNRDGRIEVLPAVTDWDNLDYAYGGIGGLFDTPPEGEPDVEQTADEAIAAMRVFTGDHQPPIIRIEQGTGLREVVVTVEDDHQIDGILFDVDGEQRNVNGDGRKTITETVSFRGRLGIATSDVTGNRPDPVVIACEEDGVAGTGIVSGVVNDQVEPAVRGVDPAIAAVVDQMNCEVIDAVEEQIETAVGEGTVPATSVSDPGIAAATPAATRSRSLSSTGSVIGTNSSRPVAKPQLPIGFLPPVLEDLLRSADGPVARILAERSLVDVGGGE